MRRTGGVLFPGFSKRFANARGTTYLWGIPIGRFDLEPRADGTVELRYLRWPIVDVVRGDPSHDDAPLDASGFVRLPRGGRVRFCDFLLESANRG